LARIFPWWDFWQEWLVAGIGCVLIISVFSTLLFSTVDYQKFCAGGKGEKLDPLQNFVVRLLLKLTRHLEVFELSNYELIELIKQTLLTFEKTN